MNINDYKKYEPFWDKWYLVKELGCGAYGSVYEVETRDFGNMKSALKIVSIPSSPTDIDSYRAEHIGTDEKSVSSYFYGIVEAFLKEISIMSQLKGKSNIVSIEDYDVREYTDGIGWDIFIRMEMLTSLSNYFSDRRITEKDVVKMGIDICRALEECEKKNIIHRDIKQSNIFVSDSGDYKLGDFGVARTLEKTSSDLSKRGTYTYMAPEVYRGDAYGSNVDIYSLGIVMYKLLNNNMEPFKTGYSHNNEENALVARMKNKPMPKPANASEDVAKIVLKACSYYSKDRFASAYDMRAALEAIAAGNKTVIPEDEETLLINQEDDDDSTLGIFSERKKKEITKKDNIKKRKKVLKKVGICAAAMLVVIAAVCFSPWFVKLSDYNAAMQLYFDKNYPEATWAFDELGSYINSKSMKDKCEKSWRKSLATVVLEGRDIHYGAYYINPNGEINLFSSDSGNVSVFDNAADNIKTDEHGKIVSISQGYPYLYALHEDGYVDNISENNDDSKTQGWENVVQISPVFKSTNIALKSNGKMIYSNPTHLDDNDERDDWLYPILEWNNIVSFDYTLMCSGGGNILDAYVLGVQADGKLQIVSYRNPEGGDTLIFDEEMVNAFHDVRLAKMCFSYAGITDDDHDMLDLVIFALLKNGDMQIYSNGTFHIEPANDVIDVFPDVGHEFEYYLLNDHGNYINRFSVSMVEDVASIQKNFLVTRSGMIFRKESYEEFENCYERSVVYDEWLERLR